MDHVDMYGPNWLDEVYKYIQEDKKEHYTFMMALFPLSRTPMDKEGARTQANYSKSVRKMIDSLTPWDKQTRRSSLSSKVKPGTLVVIPDASDGPDNPMYTGATIAKG